MARNRIIGSELLDGSDACVGSLVTAAARHLAASGIEDARHEARLLLAHAAERSVERIIGWPEDRVDRGIQGRFEALIRRRAKREPIAQILGRREFWSLSFRVSADTLTPRADSETLVEAVLDGVGDRSAPLRLLDLGTGTGCLLLALLHELPRAIGLGTDTSAAALAIAAANARALDLADRAQFRQADWGAELSGRFDIIISNPPYVATGDIAGLMPEVRDWEPRQALDGGPRGLCAYARLAQVVNKTLAAGGLAAFEIGEGMVGEVEAICLAAGLAICGRYRDLGGKERAILLELSGKLLQAGITSEGTITQRKIKLGMR